MCTQDLKSIEFQVIGRVQGVGFRHFTSNQARSLNLVGFVRNESDGSVYGIAQGSELALQQFIECLQSGPTFSKVEELRIHPCENGEWSEFQIRV